jgi:hypothetical protein
MTFPGSAETDVSIGRATAQFRSRSLVQEAQLGKRSGPRISSERCCIEAQDAEGLQSAITAGAADGGFLAILCLIRWAITSGPLGPDFKAVRVVIGPGWLLTVERTISGTSANPFKSFSTQMQGDQGSGAILGQNQLQR